MCVSFCPPEAPLQLLWGHNQNQKQNQVSFSVLRSQGQSLQLSKEGSKWPRGSAGLRPGHPEAPRGGRHPLGSGCPRSSRTLLDPTAVFSVSMVNISFLLYFLVIFCWLLYFVFVIIPMALVLPI